jgi:type II restriction enzyme
MVPTSKQELGKFGETVVARSCKCPKCKRARSLKTLPANFKCADVICDFCGYLGQVKTARVQNVAQLPKRLLGAAWGVQHERMSAGIYFSLFIVAVDADDKFAVYYLPSELQTPDIFLPREPLSAAARRAGWQGFYYDLARAGDRIIKLL